MNISLVTSARLREALGGEENFTLFLSSWLREHGHSVTIVCRSLFGVTIEEKRTKEKPIVHLGRFLFIPYLAFMFGMLLFSLMAVMKIISLNKKYKIALIHAQDTGYGGLAAVAASKIIDVPIIVSSHGIRYVTLFNSLKGFLKPLELVLEREVDRFVCRRADAIISVSEHTESYLKKQFIRSEKEPATFVVPTGVDTKKFSENERTRQQMRQQLSFSSDERVIGFVGRFSPEKNPLFLLEAFAVVARSVSEARLLLVGAGPLQRRMEEFVKKTGLNDKVVFTGLREDVNKLLVAVDIFVLPSLTEGCPTSLLEALASSRAVVASNIPSVREIVEHGKDGLLINPYKIEELEKTLLLLCNAPELREKLGLKAKQKAALYDVNDVGLTVLNIYKSILACANHRCDQCI
jgi:glycosyltransferase involved in cell wall biosynthesis